MTPQPERQGHGRRQEDDDCRDHAEHMAELEVTVSRYSGWIKATAVIAGVITFVATILCSVIISKLSSIESALSDNKSAFVKLEMGLADNTRRIQLIEEQHRQEMESAMNRGRK